MKKLLIMIMLACAVLVGCDFEVPLVETPEMAVDGAVVGLWEKTDDKGQVSRLLLLPFNEKEYMVSFSDDGDDGIFARGCLCKVGGKTFFQLKWIGTGGGELAEGKQLYQFATYSVVGETLRFRLVNPDVAGSDAKSSKALAKAFAEKKGSPGFFRSEMVFKKVKN